MKFIESFDEPHLLDFLPHFLGVAHHDNIDAAPPAVRSLTALTSRAGSIGHVGSQTFTVVARRIDGVRRSGKR